MLRPVAIAALLVAAAWSLPWQARAGTVDVDLPNGYFEREGNDGAMALITGMSEFVRIYRGWRIVRLYIPFPYSRNVPPETIRGVLESIRSTAGGSAYLRGDFGVLDQDAIAHVDTLKQVEGRLLFDCAKAVPCELEIADDEMIVVSPGLVKNKETHYRLIRD